ncbi:FdhF/YdeP family oxidoreductase [Paeniglutamicibacter kerguelensis]|uniref:Formate dehydrogenase major subunit n=1 Tax=Paeniglutamicibacter kerguelensis TaxID=254788 RepID=A0ABS4XCL2_9MICC|nr:FdhF/YdeP family oxidoreductase [Paeniglutamicibacter kerguelensis]MBP2386218.1 formate dehydrogenase major subunit [Paeniglutamicibacter kerguelensis]
MARKNPPRVDEPTDDEMEVGKPKTWAAGLPGVMHSMVPALKDMGVDRSRKTLLAMNHRDGFDCMSCAWPDPDHRKAFEFCENGAKAVTWEATPITVESGFWAEHSVSELRGQSEYWLGQQGRLTEPVYKPAGEDHYRPVGWDEAFSIIGTKLNSLASPDEAAFYTSGRTSNEAAFIYQLFVRAFGTNNLPDCSNMCHESTGWAMGQTLGIGKSTIAYDDFGKSDLIIIVGQNPGTNHPRMLTALEEAKGNGAAIVAVNPLPEAGLRRYKNPQEVKGIIGRGTDIADQFMQIRLGGDMALLQAVSKRVLEAEEASPGTVLDRQFIEDHCEGLEELKAHLARLDEDAVLESTGLRREEIDELAVRYLKAERVIITWAMGLTQQKRRWPPSRRSSTCCCCAATSVNPAPGRPRSAGTPTCRGDRTMGIWEQMPPSFLDAIEKEFGFNPPREHGTDAVQTIQKMRDGEMKVFVALGGNLVAAISDTHEAEAAMEKLEMSVQISTKLNRSHTVVGREALILPTMGRTEIDRQASGEQFVSVEDTVCAVHPSWGKVEPVAPHPLSEVAIVSRMARATLGQKVNVDWTGFEKNYDLVREHISRVVVGCADYNQRIRQDGGFVMANGPRDSRTFHTATGKAVFTVNDLEHVQCPPGRLILQTMRSHDQFNTTIYGHNDRYRGIMKGRQVVFVNPKDLAELGLQDGQYVDIHGEYVDHKERVLRNYRVVAYPSARGCAAAYYPEANVLVPLEAVAEGSNTPVSKHVVVKLVPASDGHEVGASVTA